MQRTESKKSMQRIKQLQQKSIQKEDKYKFKNKRKMSK